MATSTSKIPIWQSAKLKNLPILIIDGDRSARYPKRGEFQETGVPFLSTTNIEQGRLKLTNLNFVSTQKFSEIQKGRLQQLDIVMTTRGSIGKVALFRCIYPTGLINAQMLILRADGKEIDPRFLFYVTLSDLFQSLIRNFGSGSAQPQIPMTDLREIEIRYPTITLQRKIAGILSAYDDLIENNLRRIKILEEIAQLIYHEWFVNFHFPGHEKVEMMDSEFGPMPEGWEVRNVTDVSCFRFVRENVAPYEGVKKYFATADVRGIEIVGEGITYTFEKKPSRAQKQPPVDSVWFARMKDTYKVLVFTDVNERLAKECMLSSGFAGFQASDRGWLGYLYCTIKSDAFHEEKNRYCTGATQMSLTNEGLERIKVLAPDGRTAVAFNRLTAPVVSEILVLQALNTVLRRTCDLLLPKLISGELDVSELDIDIGEEPA